MSKDQNPSTGVVRAQRLPRWYTGRSELWIAGGVVALALTMGMGTIAMEVPDGVAAPGPQFFPALVSLFLLVVGLVLAVTVLRTPRRAHVAEDPTEISNEMLEDLGGIDATAEIRVVSPEDVVVDPGSTGAVDWRTLATVVGALAVFILVLPVVGWLLSSTALFWAIAWAFGSRRPLFDIALAALVAGLVQLAFSAGLGLTLPAGILEGAFPWIS